MAALDYVLRDCTIFVDKEGKAGTSTAISIPKIEAITEEHRGGGMPAPIDIEMGWKMAGLEFTLLDIDPQVFRLWARPPGQLPVIQVRGHLLGETGIPRSARIQMIAALASLDTGSWDVGKAAPLKVMTQIPRDFEFYIGDERVMALNPLSRIVTIGGVDRYADTRRSLGLAF